MSPFPLTQHHSFLTEIYVVGPASTGKTTLCDPLAKFLNLPEQSYVREVAREVIRKEGFTRDDVGNPRMQKAIMDAHLKREQEARIYTSTFRGKFLLSDRSAIDPLVYSEMTAASEREARDKVAQLTQSPEFQRVLPIYRRSIFILLLPVMEWRVDDGIRSMDDEIKAPAIFRKQLQVLGIPFLEIGSEIRDIGRRVSKVMEYIRKQAPAQGCL